MTSLLVLKAFASILVNKGLFEQVLVVHKKLVFL
jgi:hypothetical protein